MENKFKFVSKTVVIIFYLLVTTNILSAQKVKLKKGKVTFDGIEVFNYIQDANVSGETMSLYRLNSNEEVIFIKENNGGTTSGSDWDKDDFVTYNFLKEKIKVEIAGYIQFEGDIFFLYKQGIFDLEGNLNLEKITLFKEKYDENVSAKIIISR